MTRHVRHPREYLALVIAVTSWLERGWLADFTRWASVRRLIVSAALLCNIGQVLGHEGLRDASAGYARSPAIPQFHHLELAGAACHSDDSNASKQHALSEASLHAPALLDGSVPPRFESPSERVAAASRNRLARVNPEVPERPPKA